MGGGSRKITEGKEKTDKEVGRQMDTRSQEGLNLTITHGRSDGKSGVRSERGTN